MNNKSNLTRLLASVPFALSVPLAHAEAGDSNTAQLETVVITATRSQAKLAELPVSATVLTPEDIQKSPAQSLDQLLLTIPGINLQEPPSFAQHPTSNSVSMRGLGGYRTLVLLDGVPLNHAFSGYVQWNQVPLDAIERIEVVRGGASSLWGNYAMSGVINIVSKAPDKTGASLAASYGSDNTSQLGGAGNWVVNDALKLGLRADRYDTDGYNTTPAALRGPLDIATSFQQNNLQASALFAPSDTLSAYLRANYHDNDQTLATLASTNNQHDAGVTAGLTREFTEAGSVAWNGWYQHSRFQTFNTDVPGSAQRGQAEYVQNVHTTPVDDAGSSLQWTKALTGRLTLLQVGTDFRRISGRDEADIHDETGSYVRTDLGKGKQQFVGVFGQLGLTPFAIPLDLTLSARYDDFRNTSGFDGNPGGSGAQPDKTAHSFDPRLALRYQLLDSFALRGAAYRAFRAPTLDNLYRGFSTTSGTFLPNSQLGPETLYGGEIGADLDRGRFSAGLTLFRNHIHDLIGSRNLADDELPPGFFFGSRNINVGKVRSQGLELTGEYRVSRTLRADASYTYTDSRVLENEQDPASVGKLTPNIPYNTATAGLHWQPLARWNVAVQMRWVDRSYGDSLNSLPQDAHFVADLYSDYQLMRRLQVFGSASNLLDRQYIGTNSGYEPEKLGPPLQVFGGLRWQWQ